MKLTDLNTIIPNYSKTFTTTDFEQFFNIYKIDNNYQFNFNSTLYLNINQDMLLFYTLVGDMHWPLISYQLYGTTRLAWLLMKINNVSTQNIFNIVPAATTIKYVDINIVKKIINSYI